MNEGIRRASRSIANGSTVKRYGSRHMRVYTARKERVCVGVFHERSRITFDWNTKTTPIRALNLRKFADIVGREKLGRVVYSSAGDASTRDDDRSSTGMTC